MQISSGFLNNIPGDSAIIHDGSTMPFSLVSSKWIDWKKFTLHKPFEGDAPSLQLLSGERVACHGYITGTWVEGGRLDRQWSGISLFVVD